MSTPITTLDMYNNIKKIDFGEKIIVYKFGGPWCKACKDLDKSIECTPDIIVYEINVENEDFESFVIENNIYCIPDTIISYKSNEIRFQGVRSKDEIEEMINILKNVK